MPSPKVSRIFRQFAAPLLAFVGLGLPLRAATDSLRTSAEAPTKPRVIVLTDISNEPDDEESLVRLLMYSNEFDLEGLVATTSVWLRNQVRPDLIRRDVEAYGQIRDNLLLHAPGFPPAAGLLSLVKSSAPHFGMAGVGDGKATEGSECIIAAGSRADRRPLWITVWSGANCLAQALWDLKRARSPAEVDAFVAKLRVYTISDQDDAGYWIRQTFPKLFYIVSPSTVNGDEYYTATWTGISGDRHYRNGPFENFAMVDNPWLTEHIRENHGPLGALYPKLAYIMEGDTPSFLNLISNGLSGDESPDWGGWGGRYTFRQPHGETRPIWTNSRDTVTLKSGDLYTSNQATIWRWREAYQNDFAARMDWCVKPRAGANHNPVAVVNGSAGKTPLRLSARPGEVISLSAAGSSDPDGDVLSFHWFHYPEAGSPRRVRAPIAIDGADTETAKVTVPADAVRETMHIILEVHDNGTPRLFSYRRVIVNVQP
jgi:hypothetical protein